MKLIKDARYPEPPWTTLCAHDHLATPLFLSAILPVHPKPGAAAIRILVCATKGSAAPSCLLPGLLLNRDDGRPSAEAEAVLREGEVLPLGNL